MEEITRQRPDQTLLRLYGGGISRMCDETLSRLSRCLHYQFTGLCRMMLLRDLLGFEIMSKGLRVAAVSLCPRSGLA